MDLNNWPYQFLTGKWRQVIPQLIMLLQTTFPPPSKGLIPAAMTGQDRQETESGSFMTSTSLALRIVSIKLFCLDQYIPCTIKIFKKTSQPAKHFCKTY